MTGTLQQFLGELEILDPIKAGGLQIFGLRSSRESSSSYLTLDETLESGNLEVKEVGAQGRVPELSVKNKGDRPVLLTVGEELLGAKQNRILNVTLMVGAGTKLRVPVSCVEAGRWGYNSAKFRSGSTSSHHQLRSQLASQVSDSYRKSGVPRSDQSAVWCEISRKLNKMGSSSRSSALHQVYEDQKGTLKKVFEKTRLPEGCCGVAFASRGKLMGIEVFDQPATLSKLWKKLLRAYAIDVLEDPDIGPPVDRSAVQSCIDAACTAKAEEYRSPGLGSDIRFESSEYSGAGLVVEEQPVHAHIFSRPPKVPETSDSWPPPSWSGGSSSRSRRSRSRGSSSRGSRSRSERGSIPPWPRPPDSGRDSGVMARILDALRRWRRE